MASAVTASRAIRDPRAGKLFTTFISISPRAVVVDRSGPREPKRGGPGGGISGASVDRTSSLLLLQDRQRCLGLVRGQRHVAGLASSFRFLHERSSLRHVSPRSLDILVTARSLHVLVATGRLDVLVATRSLDILVTARSLHVLVATGRLDVLVATRSLDILVTARSFNVLTRTSQGAGRLDILVTTRRLDVLVAARSLLGLVLPCASQRPRGLDVVRLDRRRLLAQHVLRLRDFRGAAAGLCRAQSGRERDRHRHAENRCKQLLHCLRPFHRGCIPYCRSPHRLPTEPGSSLRIHVVITRFCHSCGVGCRSGATWSPARYIPINQLLAWLLAGTLTRWKVAFCPRRSPPCSWQSAPKARN